MTGADLIALQARADRAISFLRDSGEPEHMNAVYDLRMAVLEYDTDMRTARRALRMALDLPPAE